VAEERGGLNALACFTLDSNCEGVIFMKFTEEELKIIKKWSQVAENEYLLSEKEKELYKKLNA
jgi:hypothetical protein